MAHNLAKWLHENSLPALSLYNRTASKLPPASATIKHAESPREMARTCDVVITSLANDDAAKAIYAELFEGAKDKKASSGEEGEEKATIFVDTSTLYPKTSGDLEREAATIPWTFYLSAPAKEAKLVVVLSGDLFAKRNVQDMGRKIIDVGSNVERASSFKLIGNSCVLGVIELLAGQDAIDRGEEGAEAMTLADKSGVGADLLYEFIKEFMHGKKILDNNFSGETGFTATGGLKDAGHIRRLAQDHGATVPALDVAHRHLVTAIANGGGDLDWSSLVAGPRLAAGLSPFTGRKEHPHDTGFGAKTDESTGTIEPERVGGIKEVRNW
ncbi:SPOSA6832_03119 [Sporobolomyces salmonicolor]|uniref:SPOSA6832_03119-mRNA-1:cds n=1 Tax=Sporidiobolus salmonicolor TaxID=5005 RepID=A0A0D6ENP4_SPOSA|nr:SPOSA6832_03119 [Sporobolomyces salmonicolor]